MRSSVRIVTEFTNSSVKESQRGWDTRVDGDKAPAARGYGETVEASLDHLLSQPGVVNLITLSLHQFSDDDLRRIWGHVEHNEWERDEPRQAMVTLQEAVEAEQNERHRALPANVS